MLQDYFAHAKERAALSIPPLPLDAAATRELVSLLDSPSEGHESDYLELLLERIPAGVDESACVKAAYLADT